MFLGVLLGLASSALIAREAHGHRLEPVLPNPWLTASFALLVLGFGLVLAAISPRFTAGLAACAVPGAVYAALMLSADGAQQLAYGWSAIPVALGALALRAGMPGSRSPSPGHSRPWSTRRSSAPQVPRARAH